MSKNKFQNKDEEFREYFREMFESNMRIVRGRKKNTTNGHITNATNAMMNLMKSYREMFPNDFDNDEGSKPEDKGMHLVPGKPLTGFNPEEKTMAAV